MPTMNSVFAPIVALTPAIEAALANNTLILRPGQWVKDAAGNKGQLVAVRDGTIYVSWVTGRESFVDRTQRMARARYYQAKSDTPQAMVKNAPWSLRTFARFGDALLRRHPESA